MVTLNIEKMKQAGMPNWMIERITNWCVNCDLWQGKCTAGIMCNVTLDKEKKPMGEITYHLSINFWMTVQTIRTTEIPK